MKRRTVGLITGAVAGSALLGGVLYKLLFSPPSDYTDTIQVVTTPNTTPAITLNIEQPTPTQYPETVRPRRLEDMLITWEDIPESVRRRLSIHDIEKETNCWSAPYDSGITPSWISDYYWANSKKICTVEFIVRGVGIQDVSVISALGIFENAEDTAKRWRENAQWRVYDAREEGLTVDMIPVGDGAFLAGGKSKGGDYGYLGSFLKGKITGLIIVADGYASKSSMQERFFRYSDAEAIFYSQYAKIRDVQ